MSSNQHIFECDKYFAEDNTIQNKQQTNWKFMMKSIIGMMIRTRILQELHEADNSIDVKQTEYQRLKSAKHKNRLFNERLLSITLHTEMFSEFREISLIMVSIRRFSSFIEMNSMEELSQIEQNEMFFFPHWSFL